MEIFCPTCQKKLQLADTYAGQMVMCPSCTANFQAPSLAAQGASAAPIPFAPLPSAAPAIVAPSPEPARPTPSPSDLPPASPPPRGDYSHGITCTLRREVVALVAPIGTLLLFVISFFPWRHGEPRNLNLWELAFSSAGYTVFLLYVLLFILSVPLILAQPFLERKILPTPDWVTPLSSLGTHRCRLSHPDNMATLFDPLLALYLRGNLGSGHPVDEIGISSSFRDRGSRLSGLLARGA